MSELPEPLGEALRDPFSEHEIGAMWRTVRARREARAGVSRRATLEFAFATAFVAAAALFAWTRRPTRALDEGPLRLADGGPLGALEAVGSARIVRLSDGSEITLAAGAGLSPTANDGRRFEAALTGSGVFEVRPHGPRRWRVGCDDLAVEVLGTGFVIAQNAHEIRVTVRHGVVRVEGARVAGGARRLTAGEWIAVSLGAAPDTTLATRAEPVAEAHEEPEATPDARRAPRREPTEDALWERANQARIAHRYDDATRALETLARRFPAQRATATYKLGQIEMDDLHHYARAATIFERLVAMGLPAALREDGYVRWVQSLARNNDPAAARRVAALYLREFPAGRRRGDVARWAP